MGLSHPLSDAPATSRLHSGAVWATPDALSKFGAIPISRLHTPCTRRHVPARSRPPHASRGVCSTREFDPAQSKFIRSTRPLAPVLGGGWATRDLSRRVRTLRIGGVHTPNTCLRHLPPTRLRSRSPPPPPHGHPPAAMATVLFSRMREGLTSEVGRHGRDRRFDLRMRNRLGRAGSTVGKFSDCHLSQGVSTHCYY